MDVVVAAIVERTRSEGPYVRTAVWMQGCSIRCKGCCNPEMLQFSGGERMSVEELSERIGAARRGGVEGVTFLGGEPFDQAPAVAEVARHIQAMGMGVVVFTGYEMEQLQAGSREGGLALLAHTDTLVDGPFVASLRQVRRPWIGSSNQRVWHLTPRYCQVWPERGPQSVSVVAYGEALEGPTDARRALHRGGGGEGVVEVAGWAPTLRCLAGGMARRDVVSPRGRARGGRK